MIKQTIIQEMKSQKMTKKRLSDISGVQRPILTNWLNGKANLSEGNIEKVLKSLNFVIVKSYI